MNPEHPAQILPELPRGASVAIVRLRSMGDLVMLTPALEALHAWREDLRLHVVSEPAFAPVLEGSPAVANTMIFRGAFECARQLRSQKFPVLFNQHGGPTSAFLSAGSLAPVRVCWRHCRFGLVYNVRVPDATHFYGARPFHTVEHRLTQFYHTGLPRGPIPGARVYPQADAQASVCEKLRERGVTERDRYVVIHPGASHASKQWPLERFAEVARWLHANHGLRPILRLGPNDANLARDLAPFGPEAIAFDSAAMDLREAIALLAGAAFFIGNDSGPAHVAAAVSCPLVVLFGGTDPVTWGPWQARHRVVQAQGPCEKCRVGRCYASKGGRCILSIPFEAVRDACMELLDGKTSSLA